MKLTDRQSDVLKAEGHILVTGGPGSGKTTISILKAAQIAESVLRPGQKVLFLSFARATVSRVMEAIDHEQTISRVQKRHIEVDTYHSYFWRLLRTHGYLVGLPRRLAILTPSAEAIALSGVRSSLLSGTSQGDATNATRLAEKTERLRLATVEGRVCFDLFASYAADIVNGSDRIRRLVAEMYPVVILDEFQDTNLSQWQVVRALGKLS